MVVAVEGIGDITATEEASMLATTGSAHSRRIQGGILADGASGLHIQASTYFQSCGSAAYYLCHHVLPKTVQRADAPKRAM